jgi:hypothetical protein
MSLPHRVLAETMEEGVILPAKGVARQVLAQLKLLSISPRAMCWFSAVPDARRGERGGKLWPSACE